LATNTPSDNVHQDRREAHDLTIKDARSPAALEDQRRNREAHSNGAFTARYANASKGKLSTLSKEDRPANSKRWV